MKIRKGDHVEIMTGKDRGKRGTVTRVFPQAGRVLVEGVNMVKRHVKPRRSGEKGERVERPAPLSISNVMAVCPHTSKPTRVGFTIEGGEKIRISKRSGKGLSSQ